MLKLKKNVREFLKANVKPDHFDKVVKYIETEATRDLKYYWAIAEEESVFNKQVDFRLMVNDFEEVEELKLYVWYPREKFEGNPNKYWLVESDSKKHCKIYTAPYQTERLSPTADYFMYIEPLEMKDDAS